MRVRLRFLPSEVNEMVKVPRGGFLSNDGIAAISILIVHKFKLKVSLHHKTQDEGEAAVLPQCA